MDTFKIKVADTIIEIEYTYKRTLEQCFGYLTEENADFTVHISSQDMENEGRAFEKEYAMLRPNNYSLEFFAVLRKCAEKLIEFDILLMHGVAIARKNEAYLFLGKSGLGKTTHANKWLEHDSEAYIVNGDKPLIIADKTPLVSGSPWAGKEGIQTNTIVPLKAIIIMERAEDNQMDRINFSQAFPYLIQQTYRCDDEIRFKKTMELLLNLKANVRFYCFKFNNYKDDAFQVAYDALVAE